MQMRLKRLPELLASFQTRLNIDIALLITAETLSLNLLFVNMYHNKIYKTYINYLNIQSSVRYVF